jgi:putative restriction endonuclease
MSSLIETERARRLRIWAEYKARFEPDGVEPQLIRQLGIHRGQQGIFRNSEETSIVTGNPAGITVGLLHTGRVYADDLNESSLVYHYPETQRKGRDGYEIAATKACLELGLPLFVVITPPENPHRRKVRLGWVQEYDDEAQKLFIALEDVDQPPPEPDFDSTPFTLRIKRVLEYSRSKSRPNQALFRFRVMKYYGLHCAVCEIRQKELLDAAHICPVGAGGSDHPRNGLVLCLTHHRAFDVGLFGIEPNTLRVVITLPNQCHSDLTITRSSIQHLRRQPHPEALKWAWSRVEAVRPPKLQQLHISKSI